MSQLEHIVAEIEPVDEAARAAAVVRQNDLTKPPGALGRLEELGIRLSAITGQCPPPVVARPVVTLFAGDHGVCAQGISPWPQEVTVQMAANIAAGGAAISVLSRHVGATVVTTDVGIATDVDIPGVAKRNVRLGTGDISVEPAMTLDEAVECLMVGHDTAEQAITNGADCIITGEMGIGNTTPSAAVIAALTGRCVDDVVGRGAGADDEMLAHKRDVIARALALHANDLTDPLAILARVGGLEIGAMAGAILAGAQHRMPVIIDGVIASAAALIAVGLAPEAKGYLVGGHAGVEPGIAATHEVLGIVPLVDLDLRLGEGSGAALAVPLLQAAAKVMREMATFSEASIANGR